MIETIIKRPKSAAIQRRIKPANLKQVPGCLVVVSKPTDADFDALTDVFKLERGNLTDVLDANETPRLDHDNKNRHRYLYIRRPYDRGNHLATTQPLLIIYNSEDAIVIFPEKPKFFDDLLAAGSGLSTRNTQSAVIKLLSTIFSSYSPHVKNQNQIINDIVQKMNRGKLDDKDPITFVSLEEQDNEFRYALMPVAPILQRLLASSRYWVLTEEEQDSLEDIILSVDQLDQICANNAARIVSVREAYVILSSSSLNVTMKALTVVTLFITVPNVVFGLYGMNVIIPFANRSWTFLAIILGTAALIVLAIWFARRRRWI